MQSPMKTVLRILSLSTEVHSCTHGRVHEDSWTHFAIWKSCKCSTWAPQSFCNTSDKSQHPAVSKESHELCLGRLFSPSLSTVCISHRQACYFVKQLLNYPILVNRTLPTTTKDRGNLNDNCAFSFYLWRKKSFWQACLLKDYIGTVRASDSAQRSGVHRLSSSFRERQQPCTASLCCSPAHKTLCSVRVKLGRKWSFQKYLPTAGFSTILCLYSFWSIKMLNGVDIRRKGIF